MAEINSIPPGSLDSVSFDKALGVHRERLFTASGITTIAADAVDRMDRDCNNLTLREFALGQTLREVVRLIDEVSSGLGLAELTDLHSRIISGAVTNEELGRLAPHEQARIHEIQQR